jgi:hypothetical protein
MEEKHDQRGEAALKPESSASQAKHQGLPDELTKVEKLNFKNLIIQLDSLCRRSVQ